MTTTYIAPVETFAEILKATRKERNLTQGQLSNKSNIPRATIAKYESGTFEPSLSRYFLLCKILKIENDETKASGR